MNPFQLSKAVYPAHEQSTMNLQSCFPIDYRGPGEVSLHISGANEYCVFLNGKMVGYGPAKAAHGYHRVDEYSLSSKEEENRILILLSGYNIYTFDRVKEPPFVQYELFQNGRCIAFSSAKSPCFLHKAHIQKVCRFSYQRAFSESYNDSYSDEIFSYGHLEEPVALEEVGPYSFLKRNVSYPKWEEASFSLVEKNRVFLDEAKPIYHDRYMDNPHILLFPQEEWEVDPNRIVSQLEEGEALPLSPSLKEGESLAYQSEISYTGFFSIEVDVKRQCEIYLYFDEINEGKDGHIHFNPFRNTTHNIISYSLKPGRHRLRSFCPYTAHFARISALKGELEVLSFSLIRLENPDVKINYSFADKRLKKIFDAACSTFAQNAYDILTDCPSRERAGWLCDSFFTGQVESFLTGQNKVERNFLENYALYRPHGDVKEGMLPMCYPADFAEGSFIPNWAMFYGLELLSYHVRTKDDELIALSTPNLEKLLLYFEGFENEEGLLEDLENWVFVEWSHENDPESIRGVNLPSNMLYASFLEAVGTLLKRGSLIEKAALLRQRIRALGYNGTYFVDNLIRDEKGKLHQSDRIGETTQYYAFYFHVASPELYPSLFRLLLEEYGPSRDPETSHPDVYPSNAFIGDYLRLCVLLEEGYPEQVLNETVDFFYKMADQTGTLWEHAFPYGSLNHGFASYVAILIYRALKEEKGGYRYPLPYQIDLPYLKKRG